MDALWDLAAERPGETFTARQVAGHFPHHAYTTVLTVLDRLTKKKVVERIRDGRSHHYRPTGTRQSFVAGLMHEALALTPDSEGAFVCFVEAAAPDQARVLGEVLRRRTHQKRRAAP